MIEIGTSIQRQHAVLLAELRDLRDQLARGARKLNIGIAGGTHAYQHWSEQKIFPGERFHYISELYGYLAKQFTVFGQHVHVGCEDGDRALWLLHALSRYVPHFIALSASSPYVQGVDTGFDSARLNSVFAFPLSGRAPFCLTRRDFEKFFDKMTSTGVVNSMKDFYWDIRPKPEYGTIELRVCDTPLAVEKAAALACHPQCICRYLREQRPSRPSEDDYLVWHLQPLPGLPLRPWTARSSTPRPRAAPPARRHPAHAGARRRTRARPAGARRLQPDPRACSPATMRSGCAASAATAGRCRRWWKTAAQRWMGA